MESYYHEEDVARFAEMGRNAPELWARFQSWYSGVFAEGSLSSRDKSLMALAVAHALESPYLIDAYTEDALEKGATLNQLTETVHVAAAIRGGNTLLHGLQMRKVANKMGKG